MNIFEKVKSKILADDLSDVKWDLANSESVRLESGLLYADDPQSFFPPSGSSVRPLEINLDAAQIPLTFLGTGTYPYGDGYGAMIPHESVSIPPSSMIVDDGIIEKLWEKMYSQPVLVRCHHCDSVNVVTSPTCVQCGAPMGNARRMK